MIIDAFDYFKLIEKLNELERERDAYRELCGKLRNMANEMANMEIDER